MYIVFLFLLFFAWPFGGFIVSIFLLFRPTISVKCQTVCIVILSLFSGLLAFSQKSLADMDTDCIRYYYAFEHFESISPLSIFEYLDFTAILNFVFVPISAFVVSLTGNVQVISLLWTSIVYLLTFMSARKLMRYYGCFTNRNFAKLVLSLTFCFIAFVQVSELLKQASAFAVFFYGFTLFMTGGSKIITVIATILSIGIHPTSIMLLPLFCYDKIPTFLLLLLSIIVIVVAQFVDIIGLLMGMLPGGNYTELIIDRFGGGASEGGSVHYIVLQLLMLVPTIFLWLTRKTREKSEQDAVNVILLYFLISSLNFGNLVAYLRFAIFAHWLFALVMVLCLKNIRFKDVRYVLNILILCMILMTTRWTLGRTISGGYCSSYMDNSIVDIVFSTSYNYLTVDYSK